MNGAKKRKKKRKQARVFGRDRRSQVALSYGVLFQDRPTVRGQVSDCQKVECVLCALQRKEPLNSSKIHCKGLGTGQDVVFKEHRASQ